MIQLLPVHLINPGTELVMCVCKRKNVNYTDEPLHMTCKRCIDHYDRNVEWWAHKLPQENVMKFMESDQQLSFLNE